MRALIQRVKEASVSVDALRVAEIGPGLLVFLAVANGDGEKEAIWLAHKTANLRIFEDEKEKMNLSIKKTKGEVLAVSQFTLYADARKGNRPSFFDALEPVGAERLYHIFAEEIRREGIPVLEGVFGAKMAVGLVNWGPVTILLESEKN